MNFELKECKETHLKIKVNKLWQKPGFFTFLVSGITKMKIGYVRVSTLDQCSLMQEEALKKAGCTKIFTDIASGAKKERPGLAKALSYVREKDSIVVWRLDRLGRSIQHLIQIIKDLQDRKIGFTSIQENIDTTTSGGKLVFHIFGALAEFERELIRERTNAGLATARKRGRVGGRPSQLTTAQVKRMLDLYKDSNVSIVELCKMYNISRPSFYNYLKKEQKIKDNKQNVRQ